MTYLRVRLGPGERRTYEPPKGHGVSGVAVDEGVLRTPSTAIPAGELGIFESGEEPLKFVAHDKTRIVLGSGPRHPHELALGSCSAHTSPDALRKGEAEISRIGQDLREGESSGKGGKDMLKIAIVTGSTRPGRHNEAVARWVLGLAQARKDAQFELVDIAEYRLPLLDEPIPPSLGQYAHEHTKTWAKKVASFDGYVFVTPEYNHGPSGALKNALDYVYAEWNNKAAGFVSYGGAGGARAVEQLRLNLAELQVATVRAQVMLSFYTDWEKWTTFRPDPRHEKGVHAVLDQVVAWGGALKTMRMERGKQAEVR